MDPRRAALEAQFEEAAGKLASLRALDPMLIDVSLREPCFSSRLGHVLQNKLDILPMLDGFGFRDKIIATLDYQYPTHPQVEDQFLYHLNASGYDLTGCFCLTAVGQMKAGAYVPDISQLKLKEHRVPNTLNEIYLLPKKDTAQVLDRIRHSVAWLRANIVGDHGGAPRIYMNLVDLPDAFYTDRDWAFTVLDCVAEAGVDAVSFEDARGTWFPFQIAAVVKACKAVLRPSQKVLFHCHAGNGMENASALEALMAGADGYWAGMERESSTIGHASMGELIANLARAGNAAVERRFKLEQLLPIVHRMHEINDADITPRTWPIEGTDAYRQMLLDFDQLADRPMDLPPDRIGSTYRYRIAPCGSDADTVQGRVREVMGIEIDEAYAKRMILLMRQDLVDGTRTPYDQPEHLRELVRRAAP